MTRLLLFWTEIADTIQRPESRSYSTPGSVGSTPVGSCESQKVESETSRSPGFWLPDLSKTRSRPLTSTRTWVGPTAPIESGGTKPESPKSAPRNEVPEESDDRGPIAE